MSIKEKKILEKTLGKNVTTTTVFVIVLFAFSLSWFADAVVGFLPKDDAPWIMLVVSMTFLGLFYFRLKSLNKKYANDDDINIQVQRSTPKKALILTLSKHYNMENIVNIKSIKMTNLGKKKRDNNIASWQMPLEAILYHLEKLESLVIVTSNESDEQYMEFLNLLNRLIEKNISVDKVCANINELDDIKRAYHEVTDLVSGYSNKEVVYDITSGTSLNTIAGSYFTLNSDRLIQYVDTNNYAIKMYNNCHVPDE